MSKKNQDNQLRFRNKVIAFRVSPQEDEVLNTRVKLSGLTKQDFLIRSSTNQNIIVQGNPYVYKQLKKHLELFINKFDEIHHLDDLSIDDLIVLENMILIIQAMRHKKMTQIQVDRETY